MRFRQGRKFYGTAEEAAAATKRVGGTFTGPYATWQIEIPDWRPCRDNELVYKHWARARKRKRADAEIVGGYARQANVPPAVGKRRVSLEITLTGHQQEADPFAYCKSLLDALVSAGMLVDDSSAWVEWGGVTYARGEKAKTVIVLEEVV